MAATEREIAIMRAVYRKLDNMPMGFGLPSYDDNMPDDVIEKYFGGDLKDTMRELKMKTVEHIEDMSNDEMHIENRTVYHALKRYRLSAAIFFKVSTATDGKTIDKTSIPKMINQIISEYNGDFTKWRNSFMGGQTWTRNNTVRTNGEYSSTS